MGVPSQHFSTFFSLLESSIKNQMSFFSAFLFLSHGVYPRRTAYRVKLGVLETAYFTCLFSRYLHVEDLDRFIIYPRLNYFGVTPITPMGCAFICIYLVLKLIIHVFISGSGSGLKFHKL